MTLATVTCVGFMRRQCMSSQSLQASSLLGAWTTTRWSRVRSHMTSFSSCTTSSLSYGFVKVYRELPMWTTGLWDAANEYINVASVKTEFYNKWPRNNMYYNNFEISRLSLWLSGDYQRFINYIDRLGGIYYHRWGDAPIKSIAVAMFVPRRRTHHFNDIGYHHQFFHHP